ncbi:MAG TPA: amidohydrolase family protein [Spongiibacteraceae bacterium]|nr:amidohydrolase family protein [Spongiibacteraceae bacterium]
MARVFDAIIRGGTVVDGSGAEPLEQDIAIDCGRIVEVGNIEGSACEEIDAKGMLVTPGFVDIHTHYDGQATWENRLVPSSAHGVTTAVIGNCGVGFAPCKPADHELLIRLMEGVEDIPHPVLVEGLSWNWQTFPEYFDVLATRQYDMDIAGYIPHAALRVYVMGQRGVDREPATPADVEQMAAIVRDGMAAGALGFATSRTLYHRSSDGKSIPTLDASEEELMGMALALKASGKGVIQMVGDFTDGSAFIAQMRRLVERSGRPLTFSMGAPNRGPFIWPQLLDLIAQANADGLPIKAQVMPRAIGMILGHGLTLNPFYSTSSYRALAHLPLAERLAVLRLPDVRARILAEPCDPNPINVLGRMVRNFTDMFVLGDPPNYEPLPESSIAAQAGRLGVQPEELAYDLLLEGKNGSQLYLASANFPEGKLDAIGTMLQHPDVVPGLGDGGAHCGTICDGSYPTFMLTHWGRDRPRGERLTLPTIIKSLTRDTAAAVGLNDRGLLAPGFKADINIIDFDQLRLHAPEITYDLPGGGRRLVQRAEGYRATLVNGMTVYRDGKHTGLLPGRLVRGPQN